MTLSTFLELCLFLSVASVVLRLQISSKKKRALFVRPISRLLVLTLIIWHCTAYKEHLHSGRNDMDLGLTIISNHFLVLTSFVTMLLPVLTTWRPKSNCSPVNRFTGPSTRRKPRRDSELTSLGATEEGCGNPFESPHYSAEGLSVTSPPSPLLSPVIPFPSTPLQAKLPLRNSGSFLRGSLRGVGG